MEKTKELPKIKVNSEKKKPTRAEMIRQVEQELEQIKMNFHHKTGYLAGLKEGD